MQATFTMVSAEDMARERAAYNTPEAAAKRLADIKALIKVGLKVNVENALHEILVPVEVVEVGEEGFKIKSRGRMTLSKWENATFVKHGRGKPTLFDSEHSYTHIV